MPIIYKCDRCGKMFKHQNQNAAFSTHLVNNNYKYMLFRSDGNPDFAVCPNCLEELEEWFNKKSEKEENISRADHTFSFPKPTPPSSVSGYIYSTNECASASDFIHNKDFSKMEGTSNEHNISKM